MKLEDITKVVQTTSTSEVNQLLSGGFRLIKILSTKTRYGDNESILPMYILASTKKEYKKKNGKTK
jgi:hypothetical protein